MRFLANGQVYAMKTVAKTTAIRSQQASSTRHSIGGTDIQLDMFLERRLHIAADSYAPGLLAAFHTPSHVHLVVEYAPCGSLWDLMTGNASEARPSRTPEGPLRWWTNQMILAIDWVHRQGFVHRDVKPHNFLLYPDRSLKITDFGSAAPVVEGLVPPRHCGLPVGTPDYIAPEILLHAESLFESDDGHESYGPMADWWSLAVVVYELATGDPPFFDQAISETYRKIKVGQYTTPDSSADIVDLVQRYCSGRYTPNG